VIVFVFKNVVGVTTITPIKFINNVLVAPNDLALPSQAMEVNVVAALSKLTRITTLTPSSKCAIVLVVVTHVSIIINK
jgi:hypothetical protein